MSKTIAVLATLDTKGEEASFVADAIRAHGFDALLVDTGIRGAPKIPADVSRIEVAKAAGTTLAQILTQDDKNAAIESMAQGATVIVAKLYADGRLHGVVGMGGVQGTVISTRAMQVLPVGVPKVMLSAVANGQAVFGPYVGTKDVTIMHSVADIMGLNFLTRQVMSAAVGAVTGMARVATKTAPSDRKTIAVTMAGVTNPTAMALREQLEAMQFEVIGFHCNGIGAQSLEELVTEGRIDCFLDLSPHDIGGLLRGGLMKSHPDRLLPSVAAQIPIVFVPGALDFILLGAPETVPADLLRRPHVRHNPIHTHIRASYSEMEAAGRFVGERLKKSNAPINVVIPEKGFSHFNVAGKILHDPVADAGFVNGLEDALAGESRVSVSKMPLHVNDPDFAQFLAQLIGGILEGTRQEYV